jgi:hypothetical protein
MRILLLFVFFCCISLSSNLKINAQLSGSYNVGSGETYSSFTRAGGFFTAVNSQGLSGNVTVNITSNITNENGATALNQWTEFGSGGYTITIRPSASAERLIEGNGNTGFIIFNGADRVNIDGRFNGSGKYLRFRNTNSNNNTFTFINDATSNTITYCNIESGNSSTNNNATISGILFSTTTGTQGNDNNTISYCDIRDRSDASANPAYLVYSYGTTTTTARYNSGNQILNNNIYNFWKNGSFCGAVYLSVGTGNDWIISGNSFYQTVQNISTSNASGGWNVIFLNYTGINSCTVSGNYIGGSAPNCGGVPWSASTSANGALQLPGIRTFIGSTSASIIQNNTIANVNFSTRISSGALPFVGILVESGNVNVSGNTIGSSIGTGSIVISYTNNGFYTVYSRGIDHRADGNITNNTVGSITLSSSSNNTSNFDGINYTSNPFSDVTISGNLIGSRSPNSIQHSPTTYTVYMRGIYTSIDGVNTIIDSNTVSNISNNSTGTSSVMYSILDVGSVPAITNNTIHDINSPMSNTTYIGVLGIGTTSTGTNKLIQGNTMYAINGTNTAASNTSVVGIIVEGITSTGAISRNKIYDLTNTSTGTAPVIFGINAFWGSWTASNNQITLTNGEPTDNHQIIYSNNFGTENNTNTVFKTKRINVLSKLLKSSPEQIPVENEAQIETSSKGISDNLDATNGVQIQGIHDESDGAWNYYYNSVYIGGSATSGNQNSYCYARQNYGPSTVTFRNNLFFNARTGGTGYHYAIANELGGSTGWSSTASNYNVFVSSNANTIGAWNIGTNRTMDQWRTSSGGDNQSWSVTSAEISAATLFSSIASGNLNINSGNSEAWLVSGKGIAVSGQNADYEGNSRATTISGGTTDIGADEFAATPPSNPLATIDNVPGSGVTTNFTLYGRRICTINWGTGGTSYPSSMNLRYYSGVTPPSVLGGNYSNSYWNLLVGGGTFAGTTYDITIYFGDNETYTITSPSTNTRLAKSNGTWEVFPAGVGNWQTQLSWANLTVRTNGLTGFSDFALTDASAPLPVIISYFGAAAVQRDVNLKWITESEINNKGFDLERRDVNKQGYSEWKRIGFVNGKGNTNEPTTYEYRDMKLESGKYQYRLKQMDYNGNFEYFDLQNPSEIIVGVPVSVGVSQNYPNPSNPKSLIDYQLSFTGKVNLRVYDISGKELATLVNEVKDAGYYTAQFDGSGLASGIYIYRLIIEGNGQKFIKSLKMVLVK